MKLFKYAAVAMMFSSPVMAQDGMWVNFGGVSKHFSSERFQDSNKGLGIEVPVSGYLIGVGMYRNSVNRTSRYVVAEKTMLRYGPVGLGAMAGFVDGYPMNDGSFIPMVAPSMTVDAGRVGLRFIYIPQVEKRVASVISVQIRVKLN